MAEVDAIDFLETIDEPVPTCSHYRVVEPIVIRGVGRLTMCVFLLLCSTISRRLANDRREFSDLG